MAKLNRQPFFWTPNNWKELTERIDTLNKEEQAIAMQYAAFAWNLASKLLEEQEEHNEPKG